MSFKPTAKRRCGLIWRWLNLTQNYLLKYSHFYSLIPVRYPDQSFFSLFDKKRILISGGMGFLG